MAIDEITISGLISNNLLSMEYEIQEHFEHQILAEISASSTVQQQNGLKELLENARAYLSCEGNMVYVDLSFIHIPNGMENYAEMIKANSLIVIEPRLHDMIEDTLSLDDVQEKLRDYVKQIATENIQEALGGVL